MASSLALDTPAPAFALPDQDGNPVTSEQLRGRCFVLYFYPKDDTPGCTSEAKAFSELADAFAAENTTVLGVSKDSPSKHRKFIDKHSLAVTLLADEAGEVCDRFDVWKEKSMYGKTYMGIERSTFLIDAEGILRQVWPKVKVKGHAEAVLEAVREQRRAGSAA